MSKRSVVCRFGKQRGGIPAGVRGEQLAYVGEQRAVLQAAGDRRREQSLDPSFATLGLAAERELVVDDRASRSVLGVFVGRLHALVAGERPQRGHSFSRLRAMRRQRRLRARFAAKERMIGLYRRCSERIVRLSSERS
jgi:hypothetical protein